MSRTGAETAAVSCDGYRTVSVSERRWLDVPDDATTESCDVPAGVPPDEGVVDVADAPQAAATISHPSVTSLLGACGSGLRRRRMTSDSASKKRPATIARCADVEATSIDPARTLVGPVVLIVIVTDAEVVPGTTGF